jgi:hypothetical protein
MSDNETTNADRALLNILLCPIDEKKSAVDEVVQILNTLGNDISRSWGVDYAVGFEAVFHDTAEREAALALNLPSGKPVSNRIWLWKLKLDM